MKIKKTSVNKKKKKKVKKRKVADSKPIPPPLAALEFGTVTETDHEEETQPHLEADDVFSEVEAVAGPVQLVDDALPDVLLRVREKLASPPPTPGQCGASKTVNWDAFTSTWLSVSAKGVDIRELIAAEGIAEGKKPFCAADEVPVSLLTLDHLEGVKKRRHLQLASETGLREAFQVPTYYIQCTI